MKSSIRSVVMLAAIGGFVVAPARASGADVPAPAPAEEPAPAIPAEAPAVEAPTHGIVQMIGEALSDVSVNPDQAVEIADLGARLEPLEAQVDKAESDLLSALAEQVKDGKIDRPELEPAMAAYVAARVSLAVPLREALGALHEMLDKDQRANFADALECSVHDVTRQMLSHEKVQDFEMKLDLDPMQMQKVHDAILDIVPMVRTERRDVHDAIEEFRGSWFNLETYFPVDQVAANAQRRADRIVDVTQAILDVLDRDQIPKLARAIADAATAKAPVAPPVAPAHPEEQPATSPKAWIPGRVRGFPVVRRVRPIGTAARLYGVRTMAFPVVAVYGIGM